MASDIGLVLKSEHHDLLVLADQCGRVSRGLHDPVGALRRRLLAHLAAADEGVYPLHRTLSAATALDLRHAVELVLVALGDEDVTRESLAQVAHDLVDAERAVVLPALASHLPIAERRRMGKVFRIRRDAVLRGAHARQHRQRSHTELYELARRAGLENRSTMTHSQLQAAVAQWERQADHGMSATR